jgi:hypothetical protein
MSDTLSLFWKGAEFVFSGSEGHCCGKESIFSCCATSCNFFCCNCDSKCYPPSECGQPININIDVGPSFGRKRRSSQFNEAEIRFANLVKKL